MALIIPYRRKREGRTNYRKRLSMLQSGTPRLVVRKTNKQILLQIVEYSADGDNVLCGVNSNILKKYGWKYSCKNIPACYLAGIALGKIALAKNIDSAILDLGLQSPIGGSKLFASLKGVIDAGVNVPASEEIFPSADRLSGKHIASYYSACEDEKEFSGYKNEKLDASKMEKDVAECKNKIMRG